MRFAVARPPGSFYVKVAEAFERLPVEDAELLDAGDKVLVHARSDGADGQAGQRSRPTTGS